MATKLDKMNIEIIGLKRRVRKVEEGIESIANILVKSPLLKD